MNKNGRWVIWDLECLKELFLYGEEDIDSLEEKIFEMSFRKNDLYALVKHLKETNIEYQIGFNNVNYDSQLQQFILDNYHTWQDLTGFEVAQKIYGFSQKLIDDQNYGIKVPYWEKYLDIKQIDLPQIHHFFNENRRTSLKWIEFMIDEEVDEMPIEHWQEGLTEEDIEKVISYWRHDKIATRKLYNITIGDTDLEIYKGKNKIQDRLDLMEDGILKDCMNYSDVKIGDELNKIGYCKEANIDTKKLYELRKNRKPTPSFTFGQCIPKYVTFKTKEFQEFKDKVASNVVRLKKGSAKDKQEFKLRYSQSLYSIMKGGIHSTEKPRLIICAEDMILRDADVGSQYPNAIVKRNAYPSHLGKGWYVNYGKTIVVRIDYKDRGKKENNRKYKGLAETFKLCLNGGGFGKTNEPTNWQYDPFVTFQCTIGNQFEILMLIESLELEGITVVSANTDGIVCYFPKSLNDKYYEICLEWERIVGNDKLGKLEYKDYKKLYQTSVNDYIAIDVDGEVKKKGDFLTDFELNKNKSRRIVNLALEKYVVDGIPVEETIRSHDNIFDFCIGKKASSDYYYKGVDRKTGKENIYKKLIRYYISTEGEKIYKCKHAHSDKTGPPISEAESGSPYQTLFNVINHLPKMEDYKIDYEYYIDKAKEIIHKVEPHLKKKDFNQKNGVQELF